MHAGHFQGVHARCWDSNVPPQPRYHQMYCANARTLTPHHVALDGLCPCCTMCLDMRSLTFVSCFSGYKMHGCATTHGCHRTTSLVTSAAPCALSLSLSSQVWSKVPFGGSDPKAAREAWVTLAAKWFVYFEARLAERGGPFFLGKDLSLADLFVYVLVDGLKTGFFDHIPTDTLDAYPHTGAFYSAVKEHPIMVAHGA